MGTSAYDVLTVAPGAAARGAVVRGAGVFAVAVGAGGSATSTVTRTATNIANVTLLAANANRIGACFYNNAATNLFLKMGITANITAGVESFTLRIVPGAYYEVPFGYTGRVDGIWDGADAAGECLNDELTA